MHEFNDIIVRDGKLLLPDLPYPNGKHVRVIVTESDLSPPRRLSIAEVTAILKGGVTQHSDLTDPMIPEQDWEMLK